MLTSWIRILKNMRIHESESKEKNINQNCTEQIFALNPKSELSQWFIVFKLKNKQKRRWLIW